MGGNNSKEIKDLITSCKNNLYVYDYENQKIIDQSDIELFIKICVKNFSKIINEYAVLNLSEFKIELIKKYELEKKILMRSPTNLPLYESLEEDKKYLSNFLDTGTELDKENYIQNYVSLYNVSVYDENKVKNLLKVFSQNE
jgi:hypothetical protein